MDKYVLGNKGESERLDYQSKQRNYDSFTEVSNSEIKLNENALALDAGCGTGIFARRIADANINSTVKIIGLDSSQQRINEAKTYSNNPSHSKIEYRLGNLRNICLPDNSVDLIICRFVYEHIKNQCQEITNEFFRVLKDDGKLIVIDSDGILFNLDTENRQLQDSLEQIKSSTINFEGYICKKIPRYLQRSGFTSNEIAVKPVPMLFFENNDREYEIELWKMRFKQVEPIFAPILGESRYQQFSSQYIEEVMNPENFLYYSKFVFSAIKRSH